MSYIENQLSALESQIIDNVRNKISDPKQQNFKCSAVYRAFDAIRKINESLDKPQQPNYKK